RPPPRGEHDHPGHARGRPRAARLPRRPPEGREDHERRAPSRGRRLAMFLGNFWMALKAVWANKMGSMLTTLGIVIGTAAVIAVVSIVQGFSQVITNEVQNLGSTPPVVRPHAPPG